MCFKVEFHTIHQTENIYSIAAYLLKRILGLRFNLPSTSPAHKIVTLTICVNEPLRFAVSYLSVKFKVIIIITITLREYGAHDV